MRTSGSPVRTSCGDEGPRDSRLANWIAECANKLKAVILPGEKADRSRSIRVVFEVDDTGEFLACVELCTSSNGLTGTVGRATLG